MWAPRPFKGKERAGCFFVTKAANELKFAVMIVLNYLHLLKQASFSQGMWAQALKGIKRTHCFFITKAANEL